MELKERELFLPLKTYFKQMGYRVYTEVPSFHRCIDVVAVKDVEFIAVEMKMGLTKAVVRQARYNDIAVHKSYVAIPTQPKQGNVAVCEKIGIGILRVSNNVVTEILPSKIFKPFRDPPFDFTNWEEGVESGNPMLK